MSRRSQLGSTQTATDATAALAAATSASAAATSASNAATAAGVTAAAAVPKSLFSAAGGLAVATAASTPANHAAPTVAGQTLVADPQATDKVTNGYPIGAETAFDLPAGALAETLPRGVISSITLAALTSAQLFLVAVPLIKGQVVSTITFVSGSTAVNTPVNQWFALYSSARAKLGVTNDDTSTAWGSNAAKTLTLASPYTVAASGLHYLGCVVKATIAVPTLQGILVPNTTVLNVAPIICGNSDTGLTDPASAPATAAVVTVAATLPFAYAS